MHNRWLLAASLGILTTAGCGSTSPPKPPPLAVFPPPAPIPEPPAPPAPPKPATASAPPARPAAPNPSYPAAVPLDVPAEIRAIVDAADRLESDRALDAGRHPGELLAFFGVKPGMAVAEIGAGTGYTAELLARAVGAKGKVHAQNPKFFLEKFAEKPWSERLTRPVMKNVARVDRELGDPLPGELKGKLDAVFLVLLYHDTVWLDVDRAKMNKAIFDALKPGGTYAVVDHSGRARRGAAAAKTRPRIEEKVVREEIERARFVLARAAAFLRNPADPRDWNDSPSASAERRGTSDRFVLKFTKPKPKAKKR